MQHMMMPLYTTASFLVQENMSMEKGVVILQNHKHQFKSVQSSVNLHALDTKNGLLHSVSTASVFCNEIHTSQRWQR